MKAVIMAGGFGTRLRPITCNIPKPMVPVANTPMMEHIVNLLKQYDLKRICSILYFQPEIITKHFGDGSDFDIEMEYQMATADFGTAGSVKNAEDKLKDEPFIIISGDVLTDFDLAKAIDFHKNSKAMATMVLTRVKNPLEFGVVITADDGKIVRFLEKPSWGEVFSDTINTGIYILEPEVFKYIPAQTEFDFSKNLFPLMLKEELPLFGYVADGYWKDIGDLDEYRRAHTDVLSGQVNIQVPGKHLNIIGKDVWVGPGTELGQKVRTKGGVILGANCVIEAGAVLENCILGDGCTVQAGARIRDSVIWDGVLVGSRSELEDCIVSWNTQIKPGAILESGVIVSEECRIGTNAVVRANVKIWPRKVVEEGSTVFSSMVWSDKWTKDLFTDFGVCGLANVEITPEMASKLGAAFGTYLPKGTSIAASRDLQKFSRVINRALICGLASAGVHVADLRVTPAPVARYKPNVFRRGGGIHVKMSGEDPNAIEIKFFDAEGRDLSTNQKKSIERLFNREDFRRVGMEDIGDIAFPPRIAENYAGELLERIDVEAVRKRHLKVVIDYAFSGSSGIFATFLGRLGCEVIALNAFQDEAYVPKHTINIANSLQNVGSIVKSLEANVGVVLGDGAERVYFVDDQGRMVIDDEGVIAWLTMMLRFGKKKRVALPVNVTHAAEKIAAAAGTSIIRTQTSARALMNAAVNDKVEFCADKAGGVIFPDFQPAFDGMMGVARLLEYVARLDQPLSKIITGLPVFFVKSSRVPCPWEDKGKVMRQAMDFAKDNKTQLIDGVKIFLNETEWILVLPDPDKPFVNVTAEAASEKRATELLEDTLSRVEDWQRID